MRSLLRCAAALLLVTLAGCRSSYDLTRSTTQLRVGTEAAKQELWREALFRFQRAVQLDPNSATAHNNLAVAYEGIGEFEKARAEYGEALRIDKANPYVQKNYSRFVEFVTRNTRRERKLEPGAAAMPPAGTPAAESGSEAPAPVIPKEPAPAPPVATPQPPPETGGSQPVSPPPQPEPVAPDPGTPPAEDDTPPETPAPQPDPPPPTSETGPPSGGVA